jgi:Protein of unknown function (DUF1553)/Protein of unknown function (DUF1549)/Planctomycete cytochrome C
MSTLLIKSAGSHSPLFHRILSLCLAVMAWVGAKVGAAELSYNRDVRPILSEKCFACHGPDKAHRKKDLRLDVRESAVESRAIIPGEAAGSKILARMTSDDPEKIMPPPEAHKAMTPAEIATVTAWIDSGAVYQPHWAYVPVVRPTIPGLPGAGQAIDALIRSSLNEKDLVPAPPAAKETLLRRVSLDLTGLPPTSEEVAAFTADPDPAAYARVVDRLLASSAYGERMAVPWLDLVRFSDTVGYHGDQNQRIFPYRDYVIRAFNENKRFDQFTAEQLAGDIMAAAEPHSPHRTEWLVASGFNRLNMMTREGGAQPKEYLAKYAADRVRTVSMAWLGATMGCCECHDHKFDPLPTKDFYSMAAFFADLKEWGVYAEYQYTPNPELRGWSNDFPFPPEMQVDSPYLKQRQERLQKKLESLATPGDAAPSWTELAPRLQGDTWVAEVTGPATVGTVRLKVPRSEGSGLKLTLAATRTAGKKNKPVTLEWSAAYADQQKPRFGNGADVLNVKEAWNVPAEAPGHPLVVPNPALPALSTEASSWWYPTAPIIVPKGQSLTLSVTAKALPALSLAISAGMAAPEPLSVAQDRWREALALRRDIAECREGLAWSQVSLATEPRPVRVLRRGNWMDEGGELVQPATPALFRKATASTVEGERLNRLNRLDLARWLFSEENPLTSRVVMNRLWAQFFGTGLSARLDDLGAQGEWPTHPELLDWLAAEFRSSGWDMKGMVRRIVLSETYQQSSAARPELTERDPNNQWLARQNPRRLEAEFVRDAALSVAGLLVRDLGGPSIMPPQPVGYYDNLNFPQRDYPEQTDERQHRRGLYMHWQRTFLHPMLASFDAPSREECTAERTLSNTPQQALTLLNDPCFVEAAMALASQLLTDLPKADVPSRLNWLAQRVLGRSLLDTERRSLVPFIASRLTELEPTLAWAQTARVFLNLHESFTRE